VPNPIEGWMIITVSGAPEATHGGETPGHPFPTTVA
jgi:hypothetical protein